ncbi:MAG: hypothetical protein HGB17_04975 [Syntrophobacteraceae bacterium]|nr:hypothetical protein [Syntrophobacteraceae bacterium]
MSNQPRVHPTTVEPFEDRIDFLFRELELSIQWQRPSILFAVYSSEYVHSAAEADLEYKLVKDDQKVLRISVDNKENADVIGKLADLSSVQNAIFFINGLRWGSIDGTDLYQDLNNQREFFVEKQLRLVFWLTEKEVVDLANKAPDFWAFRHRVIEFNDSPNPELIYQNATESSPFGRFMYFCHVLTTINEYDVIVGYSEYCWKTKDKSRSAGVRPSKKPGASTARRARLASGSICTGRASKVRGPPRFPTWTRVASSTIWAEVRMRGPSTTTPMARRVPGPDRAQGRPESTDW